MPRSSLSKPAAIVAAACAADLDIVAADSTDSLPRFSMTAYTGGPMRIAGYGLPVVIDLASCSIAPTVAILKDHQPGKVVGHAVAADVSVSPQRIKASGVISGTGPDATEVVANSKNKFPWQASVGGPPPDKVTYLDRGESRNVNGRVVTGPKYILEGALIREISVLSLGADGNTSTNVAAGIYLEECAVNFSEWLAAKKIDESTMSPEMKAVIQSAFEAEQKLEAKSPGDENKDDLKAQMLPGNKPVTEAIRAAEELESIAAITTAAKGFPAIAAKALREGWSIREVQLQCKLESRGDGRGNGPAIHVHKFSNSPKVLEAALCTARGLDCDVKEYGDETLQAAHTQYRRGGIGLQQILLIQAAENGMNVGAGDRIHPGNLKQVLRFAMPEEGPQNINAASTVSLPGILGNVANKDILKGYMEEDQSWREIARIAAVQNFQTHTSYRMLDNMSYEELGPSGEIKHGTLGQESYTREADTFAKMFTLTRKNIINDDLSAFDDLRTRIGRGGAMKLSRLFWSKWLDNAAFFTSARGNYISGSTSNLLTDGVGLQLALNAFDALRTPIADGSKVLGGLVGGAPTLLLAPGGAIFSRAEILYKNSNLGAGTSNADANIYSGRYRPVKSVFLNDTSIPNYSATGWYLLRDPKSFAGVVVSFLNGAETPTVDSAEADFNTLGIQFRGYHDFGVDLAEYLCGVMSKGAA